MKFFFEPELNFLFKHKYLFESETFERKMAMAKSKEATNTRNQVLDQIRSITKNPNLSFSQLETMPKGEALASIPVELLNILAQNGENVTDSQQVILNRQADAQLNTATEQPTSTEVSTANAPRALSDRESEVLNWLNRRGEYGGTSRVTEPYSRTHTENLKSTEKPVKTIGGATPNGPSSNISPMYNSFAPSPFLLSLQQQRNNLPTNNTYNEDIIKELIDYVVESIYDVPIEPSKEEQAEKALKAEREEAEKKAQKQDLENYKYALRIVGLEKAKAGFSQGKETASGILPQKERSATQSVSLEATRSPDGSLSASGAGEAPDSGLSDQLGAFGAKIGTATSTIANRFWGQSTASYAAEVRRAKNMVASGAIGASVENLLLEKPKGTIPESAKTTPPKTPPPPVY